MKLFFAGSLIYAFSAFFNQYAITLAVSVPLYFLVEKIRIQAFSWFPSDFFQKKVPVTKKFHQASLLCLSTGIAMAAVVILNNEYFHWVHMENWC